MSVWVSEWVRKWVSECFTSIKQLMAYADVHLVFRFSLFVFRFSLLVFRFSIIGLLHAFTVKCLSTWVSECVLRPLTVTSYNRSMIEKRKTKSEKRKSINEKRKTKWILSLTKWTSAYGMSCLMDVKHSLAHFLTYSLTQTLTYSCTQITVTTWHRPDRKGKSEKRKAKSEKRKAKNKKNLDFDEMNVCIWHELFDWRKTLTHFLTHPLAHSDTHVYMYADNSYNMTQPKTKSKKQNESRLWRNECLHMTWAVWLT